MYLRLLLIKLIFLSFIIGGCGRIYFPVELQTKSRNDRSELQQVTNTEIIPMTSKSVSEANYHPYSRQILLVSTADGPATRISAKKLLKENLPSINDPGPYLLGKGDLLNIVFVGSPESIQSQSNTDLNLIVNEEGFLNLLQVGKIKAEGKTLSQLEDLIYDRLLRKDMNTMFGITIIEFNSKQVFITAPMGKVLSVPYTATPLYLEQILAQFDDALGESFKIKISRGTEQFSILYKTIMDGEENPIRLFPNDRITITKINFKKEKVLIVGETGSQRAEPISADQRPTLSDTLFSGSVLNNITSDFSQIYVIRERNLKFKIYHLDISDPTRIHFASIFEMRPDDIIFVAAQPLSLYSRTLSQILGSTGLTLQARDTIRAEIGN